MNYHRDGIHILKVAITELKSIKYTMFTRNKIRRALTLQNDKELQKDPLNFRNECFAYYSLLKQELHTRDLQIKSEIHLNKTMRNNCWVK